MIFQSKESTKEASEWTFKVNKSNLQLWDINGELKNRQLWPNYYQKAKVLVRSYAGFHLKSDLIATFLDFCHRQ